MAKTKDETNAAGDAPVELTEAEKMAKCRERYKRIKDLRSEKERHDDAAKACKMQIDAALAEIEDVIVRVDNQIPLPIGGANKNA